MNLKLNLKSQFIAMRITLQYEILQYVLSLKLNCNTYPDMYRYQNQIL